MHPGRRHLRSNVVARQPVSPLRPFGRELSMGFSEALRKGKLFGLCRMFGPENTNWVFGGEGVGRARLLLPAKVNTKANWLENYVTLNMDPRKAIGIPFRPVLGIVPSIFICAVHPRQRLDILMSRPEGVKIITAQHFPGVYWPTAAVVGQKAGIQSNQTT